MGTSNNRPAPALLPLFVWKHHHHLSLFTRFLFLQRSHRIRPTCIKVKAHLSKSLSVRRRIEDVWAHVLPLFAAASSAKRDVNAAPTAANALPNAVKKGSIQHGGMQYPKGNRECNEGR